jgi:hypothetical protein
MVGRMAVAGGLVPHPGGGAGSCCTGAWTAAHASGAIHTRKAPLPGFAAVSAAPLILLLPAQRKAKSGGGAPFSTNYRRPLAASSRCNMAKQDYHARREDAAHRLGCAPPGMQPKECSEEARRDFVPGGLSLLAPGVLMRPAPLPSRSVYLEPKWLVFRLCLE